MAGPEEWRAARPRVRQARDQLWERFRDDQNVLGIGFGPPTRDGRRLDEPSCVVFVAHKIPLANLAPEDVVPRTLDIQGTEVETDVVETGRFYAYEYAEQERPATGGISVGHFKITAGTLGCLVKDVRNNGQLSILSNNHVLANENNCLVGDPIHQPGPLDADPTAGTRIGKLSRWINLKYDGSYNSVDAAIATPDNDCLIYDDMKSAMTRPTVAQPAVGLLFGGSDAVTLLNPIGDVAADLGIEMVYGAAARSLLTEADVRPPGAPVHKTGRTTEYTTGRVTAIDQIVRVAYNSGVATFDGVISTTPMSRPGDSGSVVCRGGSGEETLVFQCPFLTVAEDLTGVPFTQEWLSITYARDKYLAGTLVGQWLIDTLYLNEPTAMRRSTDVRSEIPAEDRAFAQALYAQHGGELKLALMNPDRDDVRVSEQFLLDTEEALARARRYMLPEEADAAQRAIALIRQQGVVGKNGRALITMLDSPELLAKLKEIVAGTGSLLDPDD